MNGPGAGPGGPPGAGGSQQQTLRIAMLLAQLFQKFGDWGKVLAFISQPTPPGGGPPGGDPNAPPPDAMGGGGPPPGAGPGPMGPGGP